MRNMSVLHARIDDDTYTKMIGIILMFTDHIKYMKESMTPTYASTPEKEETRHRKVSEWNIFYSSIMSKYKKQIEAKYDTLYEYTITSHIKDLFLVFNSWDLSIKKATQQIDFFKQHQAYTLKYPDTEKNWKVWYERQPVVPQAPRAVSRPPGAGPRGHVANSQQTGMGETQEKPKRKRRKRKNNQPPAGANAAETQRKDLRGQLQHTLTQLKTIPPKA